MGRRSDQKEGLRGALGKEICRAKGSSYDVGHAEDARPVTAHLVGGWDYGVDA
jgi:hypothetical protein